jgi:hypothetical protein
VGWRGGVVKRARHVALLSGRASTVALRVITSRLGDAANGSRDVLPGFDRSALGDQDWRMGAGIDSSEVDTTSFLRLGLSQTWSYPLDAECDLADFLHEFCLLTDSAWLVNRAGKLCVTALREDSPATVLTIDESMIRAKSRPAVRYDEETIRPRVHVECNYDPISQEYRAILDIHDAELQRRYRAREDALEVKSKSIVIDGQRQGTNLGSIVRPSITLADLESKMRSIQAADGRGRVTVSLECDLRVLAAEVGDLVRLSVDVPDLEGSAAIESKTARVIAMRPRFADGAVDVELQLLDHLYAIAASAIIAAASSDLGTGYTTINFKTTGPEIPDANPAAMFKVGDVVQLWDISAGIFERLNVLTTDDVDEIVLDDTPAFAMQVNVDIVCIAEQPLQSSGTSNANGFDARADYLFQMPNDENNGDADPITRWR